MACSPDEHLLAACGAAAGVDTTGNHNMAEGKHTREVLREDRSKKETKGEPTHQKRLFQLIIYQTRVQ